MNAFLSLAHFVNHSEVPNVAFVNSAGDADDACSNWKVVTLENVPRLAARLRGSGGTRWQGEGGSSNSARPAAGEREDLGTRGPSTPEQRDQKDKRKSGRT
ncbi:hypothetical protein DIPPA_12280 [Diplonema papillatum]|nr:hypothetical protein DIPPA_12280 [Diplonema papillatum]